MLRATVVRFWIPWWHSVPVPKTKTPPRSFRRNWQGRAHNFGKNVGRLRQGLCIVMSGFLYIHICISIFGTIHCSSKYPFKMTIITILRVSVLVPVDYLQWSLLKRSWFKYQVESIPGVLGETCASEEHEASLGIDSSRQARIISSCGKDVLLLLLGEHIQWLDPVFFSIQFPKSFHLMIDGKGPNSNLGLSLQTSKDSHPTIQQVSYMGRVSKKKY